MPETFYVATHCYDTDEPAVLRVAPVERQEHKAVVTCSACEQAWTSTNPDRWRSLPSVSAVAFMAASV